ncbi:MAG: hypothetical protein ACI9FG_001530 [Crocinitomicaceae bacterium]|jgi:hypothetical protein
MKQFLLSLATLTICASSSYAATYIEPNLEGKTLVKIEQIPLDSNTMRWMAIYLTELAEQQAGSKDAKKLKASTKLLALAEQLDKSLPQISAANLKLKNGTQTRPNEKRAKHNQNRLRGILEYLETDESNNEGKVLVDLTKDAIAAIVPQNSPLAQFSAPDHLWKNSIASYKKIDHIETPKIVNNEPVKRREIEAIPKPIVDKPTAKVEVEKQPSTAAWRIKDLVVLAPLTTYKLAGEYRTPVESTGLNNIKIQITPGVSESTFVSKPHYVDDHLAYLSWSVLEPLQSQWENIPPAKFSINLNQAYSYRSDGQITTGSIIVALDSALLGSPLKKNLLVISSIDKRANFKRSRKFWETLNQLAEEARDSRILVGQNSEEYLLQLLALGHPEFFIQNEVIEIENLKQARKLTSKKDHPDLSEATTLFAEVKSAIERKSLRSMTGNKFVREKLERVLEIMPNHLSAKILLEYGSRKNASLLESKFFALSVKDLLDPINRRLTRDDDYSLSERYALSQRDRISKGLEALKNIISSEDRKVYDKVDEVCEILRRFGRAKKNSNDESSANNAYHSKVSIKILRELKSLNNEIQVDLARLSGVPLKVKE